MPESANLQFDLFLTHAPAERDWVQGYLLPALGLSPERTITPDSFQPGAPVAGEIERAVTASRYTVLVLSPAYLADEWSVFGEHLVSHLAAAERSERLIPLRKMACDLPLRIAFRVSLDCTDPGNWDHETARLRGLLGQPEPARQRVPCPYPGMVPFRPDDARFFFGRETEIQEMLQRLRHQRCLFVIGPSGSGKSSLVRAGLLPRLTANQQVAPGPWRIRELRPGGRSLVALTEALGGDPTHPTATLGRLLAGPPAAERLLLVVDQFEELFTQNSRAEQHRFLAALRALREVERCTLLLAMRADFYPDLMHSDLWPVDPSERLEIAPLRGGALRQAIQEPAVRAGVFVEASLVERLAADAADEPGVLPLLQETMILLWEKMERRLLPLTAYEQLGSGGRSGLAVAMATKADATLAGLSPAGQAQARRVFLRLVQVGEGRGDTRRQQRVSDLRTPVDDERQFDETLQHLDDNRLLTLSGEAGDAEKKVDIAHEMLIRYWPRLRGWLDEDRVTLRLRESLRQAAEAWETGRRGGDLLVHRGANLKAHVAALLGSALLNRKEQDYLRACVKAERWRRGSRAVLAAVLVLLLAAVGVGIYQLSTVREDKRNRFVAERIRQVLTSGMPQIAMGHLKLDEATVQANGFSDAARARTSLVAGLRGELDLQKTSLTGTISWLNIEERLRSQRQLARTVLALAHLGASRELTEYLSTFQYPTLRTYLIHESYLWLPPDSLAALLARAREPLEQYCLILALAECSREELFQLEVGTDSRQSLAAWLLHAYRQHDDPGVHAAAEWALQSRFPCHLVTLKLDQHTRTLFVEDWLKEFKTGFVKDGLKRLKSELAMRRQWYVNHQGTTMVYVPPRQRFQMGSPDSRGALPADLHVRVIPWSFCIASTEVTVGQVRQCRSDLTAGKHYMGKAAPEGAADPMNSYQFTIKDWQDYWDRLSLTPPEGKRVPDSSAAPPLPAKGGEFRPPTEAEWEYCCRAGATDTPFFFGEDARFLSYYATIRSLQPTPVGTQRPSPWGLFDLYGSVSEICLSKAELYDSRISVEVPDQRLTLDQIDTCVVRGGKYTDGRGSSYLELQDSFSSYGRSELDIFDEKKVPRLLRDKGLGLRLAQNATLDTATSRGP